MMRILKTRAFWQAGIAAGSLTAIAVGLWWERPSLALIVIGSVLLSGITYARTR